METQIFYLPIHILMVIIIGPSLATLQMYNKLQHTYLQMKLCIKQKFVVILQSQSTNYSS